MPYTMPLLTSKALTLLNIKGCFIKSVSGQWYSRGYLYSFAFYIYRVNINYRFPQDSPKEHDSSNPYKSARRSDYVSSYHRIWVIGVSTRHALEPKKVLREERKVHPYKHDGELCLCHCVIKRKPSKHLIPEIKPREDSEDSPY